MLAAMPTHGPRTRMREVVDTYIEQRRPHVARTTVDSMLDTLGRFADWWDGTRKVPKSLREQDVRRYVWGRHDCGARCRPPKHYGPGLRGTYADSTVNRAAGQLGAFLEWAFRRDHVRGECVDACRERAKARRRRRVRLDRGQLVELYEGADDPYHRWILALAVHTAGRGGELLTLRVGDLDLDAGELVWARHKTGDDADTLPVVAELEAEARRWLAYYEQQVGPLHPDMFLVPRRVSSGRPDPAPRIVYRPDEPRRRALHVLVKPHLARVLGCDPAELRGEGAHTARRSMARHLYERLRHGHHADPLAVVQAMLGHSSRETTERYIGVESGRLERDRLLRGRSMLGEM